MTDGEAAGTPQDGAAPHAPEAAPPLPAPYSDTWVVLPTYDEAENLPGISQAILDQLPGSTLLVVDDRSPDGTGEIADGLAIPEPRIRVLHRPGKQGLGKAYVDGFRLALGQGARRVVQMDADWSHDPTRLPALLASLEPGSVRPDGADLVIGSRYTKGGGVRDWGILRRIISRGGSMFARFMLHLTPHDLTGGYKAWTAEMLGATPWDRLHSGGYVFSIEMTYLADRRGARIVEIPIIFADRRAGVSKMSRRIIGEALLVVLRLRFDELRGHGPRRLRGRGGRSGR
jgi:dolichol-phosphate mannosyltransferase